MDTQPLIHDEISELSVEGDMEEPCCSHSIVSAQPLCSQDDTPAEEDGFPGLVITFPGPRPSEHSTSEDGMENSPIEEEKYKLYGSRYYVLFLFCMLGFMQGGLTLSWNVVAVSVKAAFGWTDSTLAFIQSWVYTTYLATVFPFAWLMEKKGLRIPVIITAVLLACGTFLRCISTETPQVTIYATLGHILVGLAGPVAFTAGPVVSATWFSPYGRATATAFMTISGFAGSAACFLEGPLVVSEPIAANASEYLIHGTKYTNLDAIKSEIRILRYCEFAICSLIFVAVVMFFPAKPPTPPSRSASMEKLHLKSGLKDLLKKGKNFWLVAMAYGLSTGIYAVWSGLLSVNLAPLGVSESKAGWLGFAAVTTGCVFAVAFGRLADIVSGKMKLMIMFLILGCILSTYSFLLIGNAYVPYSDVGLWVSCIIQGLCNNAPIPLFFELAIESAYPVPEVVTSAVMSFFFNIFPGLFLCIFQIPNIGTRWMNWAMYAAMLMCMPLMVGFKERYRRLALDTHNKDLEPEPEPSTSHQNNPEEGLNVVRQRTTPNYGSIN